MTGGGGGEKRCFMGVTHIAHRHAGIERRRERGKRDVALFSQIQTHLSEICWARKKVKGV